MEEEKTKKTEKVLCVDSQRYAEYYGLQSLFDNLYARSKQGEYFTNLMDIILSRENILLAYRSIKTNDGSMTPGTDKLTIKDIANKSADDVVDFVRYIVCGSKHGYRPKPVRRKDIPKPNGTTRPLGIPCIWDRLVQQCIKQILDPICEAKFSENSYGFRPNRSVEDAIARTYQLIQLSHLHYVIEFDIKSFFDNVDHPKLMRQLWAMGIRDKHLLYVIKRILKGPIKLANGEIIIPNKGTPQGGILSPLLANIVLNELDHWVESNWQWNPLTQKYSHPICASGAETHSHGYRAMRTTRLKEMFIVRYADDFRIFCRSRNEAIRTKHAISQWIAERLKLEVSPEKTRIINVKHRYTEFLGFKIKAIRRHNKYVVHSHICDKQLSRKTDALKDQAKRIAKPRPEYGEIGEINLFNSMVLGMHNYYCIATAISEDARIINRLVMTVLKNRLSSGEGIRLIKHGRPLSKFEKKQYGKSKMLRYVAGSKEPIYPIAYVKYKRAILKNSKTCCYTTEGRKGLHDNLRINTNLMLELMRNTLYTKSIEYSDNRISLFSAQWGRCAITGVSFASVKDIHCHHKKPTSMGGTDKYDNLILVLAPVHKLIHAKNKDTIEHYLNILNLNKEQLRKVNKLRALAGIEEIL